MAQAAKPLKQKTNDKQSREEGAVRVCIGLINQKEGVRRNGRDMTRRAHHCKPRASPSQHINAPAHSLTSQEHRS